MTTLGNAITNSGTRTMGLPSRSPAGGARRG